MKSSKIITIISIVLIGINIFVMLIPNIYLSTRITILSFIIPSVILIFDMILKIIKEKDINQKSKIFILELKSLFIIYCLFLTYVLFFNINYRNSFRMVNLEPFATINRYIKAFRNNYINPIIVFINIGVNIVLFMPMGFFVPILFKKKIKNIVSFSILNLIIIFSIEVTQYLTCTGSADIDDIILNIIGAIITYIVIKTKAVKNIIRKLFYYEY